MGLDMYLNKKTYVQNWNHQSPEEKHKIVIKLGGEIRKDIKPNRISEIVEQVGYWRKSNQIHHWFVENCQGGRDECQESYVSVDQLKELLDICEQVKTNPDRAEELLPGSRGFFFGSTEIDEYYIQDIKDTIKILKQCIKESLEPKCGSFYYQASW